MPNLLISGATGFLGKQLVKSFPNYNILGISSEYDLKFKLTTSAAFLKHKPDAVIHAAASCGGIEYNEDHPFGMIYDNLLMGLNIISEAVNRGVERLVLISTTCAYPKFCPTPFKEEDIWNGKPEDTNFYYSEAKRALGLMCEAIRKEYGYDYITVIPANLIGPNDRFDERAHILPAAVRIISQAQRNKTDAVFLGSPEVTRDLLDTRDAARAISVCLEKYHEAEPINIGSGREITMRELLYEVADQLDFPQEKIVWLNKLPGQPKRVLDISKITNLGWQPKYTLFQSVQETIKEYNVYIHNSN